MKQYSRHRYHSKPVFFQDAKATMAMKEKIYDVEQLAEEQPHDCFQGETDFARNRHREEKQNKGKS